MRAVMVGLKDIGCNLPPGFRFCPSDEELVCHYLFNKKAYKANYQHDELLMMVDIDLHTCEPWHLPEVAKLNPNEWYFFSFRDRKYATGYRANRATTTGYWKATGKDRTVVDSGSNEVVGMRKTLVFYLNRAPQGIKTDWIMHEFRLIQTPLLPPKEDWVLCRVFHKSKGDQSICNNNNNDPTRTEFSAEMRNEDKTFISGQHSTPTPHLSKLPTSPNSNMLQMVSEDKIDTNDSWVNYNTEMLSPNVDTNEFNFVLWDMMNMEEIKGSCLFS